MKVQFKYPRSINGKDYSPGVHQIPDTLEDHWYVKALVKCGDVVVIDEVKEKVISEKKEPAVQVTDEEIASSVEDPASEDSSFAQDDDSEFSPKEPSAVQKEPAKKPGSRGGNKKSNKGADPEDPSIQG